MTKMMNHSNIIYQNQGLRLEEGTHGPSLLTVFNSSNVKDDITRDTNHLQGAHHTTFIFYTLKHLEKLIL